MHCPAPLDRVAWNLRELTTPYELGRTDVVVTPLAALLPLAARGRRLPVVAINFGLNLIWRRASRARRVLLRSSLRAAARVICLGESQRSELIASAGLDATRVVTMPIPVDTEFFSARGEPDGDARTVLTVGKDLARDYGTFIEAVRPLAVDATIVAHPRNLDGLELLAERDAAQRAFLSRAPRALCARRVCRPAPARARTTCTAPRAAA